MESSSASASGSSKRARTPGNGVQVPSCLVDGCTADLSKCRDYHRRHKVCELHSKTPTVTIRGQEQRFCQQCSRFHSLVEFDEGKRSCRKRLDGHNRRRRKPQPDSLSINSGRFFPNHQGTKFIPFGSSRVFSTSAVTSAWAKSDAMHHHHHHHSEIDFSNRSLFHGSSSHNYKGGKQFPFLEGTNNSTLPEGSVCQTLMAANSSSSSRNGSTSSGQKTFSDMGLNRAMNSSRALSLLSSPQPPPQQAETRMVQADSIPRQQAQTFIIPSLNYSGLGMEGEPIGSSLVSSGGSSNVNNNHLHGHDMFQIGPDGSSTNGTHHQTLSFSWE